MYAAGKKEKKNEPREQDLSAAKPERGRLRGTLEGRYNQARRKERERPVGWGARAGSMVWDLKSSQQGAAGQQRANTVIRYVGPMRAINMTPVVGNVEP